MPEKTRIQTILFFVKERELLYDRLVFIVSAADNGYVKCDRFTKGTREVTDDFFISYPSSFIS